MRIIGADPLIMDSLYRQTERRHPDWFDIRLHPPASGRERHKIRMEIDKERGIKQGLGRKQHDS